MLRLEDIFLGLMKRYCADISYNAQCWMEIENKYTQPWRFYHTLAHLETILKEFELVQPAVQEVDVLLFAIFYHDIVYNPLHSNNEQKSARLFRKRIAPTHFSHIAKVITLIKASKTHRMTTDFDTNLFLDLDLLILGSKRKAYMHYCENIRKEYRMFPDFIFRQRRKKLLLRYLSLESIYKTPYFIERYEAQARKNLRYSIRELS
ncbi:MAG: hypothetical protein WBA61_09675 [Aequorivita sp.]